MSKNNFFSIVIFVLGVFLSQEIRADEIRKAGDYLQLGLPLVGLGVSVIDKDHELIEESLRGMTINTAITQSLKYSINRTRPDGDDLSFPSGHTSAAFHGAAFIAMNFDSKYTVPAYALATLVGYSRVRAKRHYISDVVAGAAVGIISAKLAKEDMHFGLSTYKDQKDTIWIRFYKTF
jgi:hypothetical protein